MLKFLHVNNYNTESVASLDMRYAAQRRAIKSEPRTVRNAVPTGYSNAELCPLRYYKKAQNFFWDFANFLLHTHTHPHTYPYPYTVESFRLRNSFVRGLSE